MSAAGMFLLAFLSCFIATGVMRVLSHKIGFVYRPVAYRWNQRQVALGGGIAITLCFLGMVAVFAPTFLLRLGPPVLLLSLMGLADDKWILSPRLKLLFQFFAAFWALGMGYHFQGLPWVLSLGVSFIWIVGMTNAFNIIDNIDGLAGGIGALSGFGFFVLLGVLPGKDGMEIPALILAGIALGFLAHNRSPASIFMGDTGTLPMGFLLGIFGIQAVRCTDPFVSPLSGFLPVFFVLLFPLFDTLLVSISRTSIGRSIAAGGKDHTSHRLVKLGFSDGRAVWWLHLISALGLWVGIWLLSAPAGLAAAVVLLSGFFLMRSMAYLLQLDVYHPEQIKEPRGWVGQGVSHFKNWMTRGLRVERDLVGMLKETSHL